VDKPYTAEITSDVPWFMLNIKDQRLLIHMSVPHFLTKWFPQLFIIYTNHVITDIFPWLPSLQNYFHHLFSSTTWFSPISNILLPSFIQLCLHLVLSAHCQICIRASNPTPWHYPEDGNCSACLDVRKPSKM
jgi:hypothetical protein